MFKSFLISTLRMFHGAFTIVRRIKNRLISTWSPKIVVIFLITFTTINTTPCKENPACECSSKKSEELNVVCNVDNSTGYIVNIKSRNNIQIVCKNWRTWEDFFIRGRLSEKKLQSLSFEKCGLPDGISLKNIVKQLGVTETHTLIFKSFKNLFATLKREHLKGFKNVNSLVLSNNGLFHISNDFILDFPELEHIDLSNNYIDLPDDIFIATPNLKRIILNSSGIDIIPLEVFYTLEKLESLNIMSNLLEEIEVGTFDQLVSLTCLNLANNSLRELPSTIFHGLKNLKRLDISMNYFTYIPANLFDQNKELRELYLNSNFKQISTLPDFLLASLTKLQHVHLNNNRFISLPENLFWGSLSLEYIFLNDNSFVTLPNNIFRGLKKVRKLSLNNNKINTLPNKIFEDMEKLRVLDLSDNQMFRVSRNLFLGMGSLYELNMERNQLLYIDKEGLAPLINLCIARFSHNPLSLPFANGKLSVFYRNRNLEELYLSNSSLYSFFDDLSSGHYKLKLLDLSHNFIISVTASSFISPSHKMRIDLRYNKIKNIYFDRIEDWENRNIVIDLRHSTLLCDCSLYDLLRYRERKMITPVYNYFNIIMGNLTCVQPDGKNEIEISNLHSSTYKCLEHEYFETEKKCQNDCTCSVRPSDKTRILDCSYKYMSEFLIDKRKVIFERDNPFILNLTGNFLTEIPSTETFNPINVTGLLLSNNKISSITLDKLPYSLKVLELHNNHISRIFFHELSYLKSIHWEKFTLSGNPIICDCNNRNLIEFVQSHRVYYEDLDNLTCINTHLPMHQIPIEKMCFSYLEFYNYPLSLAVILGAIVISIFYNRKNINLSFVRHISKYKVYITSTDLVGTDKKKYVGYEVDLEEE
ncbi:PREDICTED: protein toll-like [Polistes canadensis]|uniref:protein toll-like n=1 Tax=Polistes canadensis TaxID=91411 RepID=UPI000718D5A9|nr:PREDICTED: protein toll-like [Polistes canadensis]